MTNTRNQHNLYPPVLSLLFHLTYYIKNCSVELFYYHIYQSGIISKNGAENYYLTIDTLLVLIQSFICISALSHPHFFVKIYYDYIIHKLKNHQNIFNPFQTTKNYRWYIYQLNYKFRENHMMN